MYLVIYLPRNRQESEDAEDKLSQTTNLKAGKVSREESLHVGLFFKPFPWALSLSRCKTGP